MLQPTLALDQAINRAFHSDSPIFLVGAERSGTTMLRLMLDGHPELAFHGEFEFLVELVTPRGVLPTRHEFERFVATDRVFQHWGLTLPECLSFSELAESFLEQKRSAKGAKLRGATVHRHFDRLLHIWPDARFIHIVRDGRDVAMSRVKLGWAGNLYCGIAEWAEAQACWTNLTSKLDPGRYISLRYESLVSEPISELSRVCHFLGLEYDPAMLDYPRLSTYSAPTRGMSGKWRQVHPTIIAAAESRAAPWLQRAGYVPSQRSRCPTPVQAYAYKLHDRISHILFRRQRYGTILWLQDLISRRLPSGGWRSSVIKRLHAVDARHLK